MIDYSAALSMFINGLTLLGKLGFDTSIVETKHVDLVGKELHLTYKNLRGGRSIKITYGIAQLNLPNGITATVSNVDGSHFLVSSWLKANDMNDAITFFAPDDPDYNEGQFIEKFCRDFGMVCQNQLRKILIGDEWQDVPFDWKGYR